ncbi:MAG: hypothetical protein ABSB26_01005 [Nitrososphaerales archaeon]|jgi:hypothetical protein
MKNEIAAFALIVTLVVGIGIGYLGSISPTNTQTATKTETTTASSGLRCSTPSPLPVLPVGYQGYSWAVHYSGQWNATSVGITGSGSVALNQCYSYRGDGYVYVPAWTTNGGTTLVVTAHKMDASGGTMTLAMNGHVKNTSSPYGMVAVEAYVPVANCNTFVGCEPIDVPIVLNAFVNQSSESQNCGITTQGYPQAVVCEVSLTAGTSGTIVLNMTSQNGDSMVAFGAYSSESQYVQFTLAYPCSYSARCPVLSSGSVYRFNYTVAPSLPAQRESILTIVVTKACCWP